MRIFPICEKCGKFLSQKMLTKDIEGDFSDTFVCTISDMDWKDVEYFEKSDLPERCEYKLEQTVLIQKKMDVQKNEKELEYL